MTAQNANVPAVVNENLSLFEIRSNRVSLEEYIELLGGELTEEVEKALQLNKEQLEKKGESYIFLLEQLAAYTEFNKRYLEQAKANIERAEKTAERLKDNLLLAVKTYGQFNAGIHKIGTRKSESVTITDENELDLIYVTSKVVKTPDKKLIKEALKGGLEVKGAEITNNLNLKIS